MAAPKIRTVSPSTNKIILERDETTLEQAKDIFRNSSRAFSSWRETPFGERKTIVTCALDLIQQRKEQLGEELTLQMGRPIAYGVKEVETMQKRAIYLLSIVEDALQPLPGQPEAGFWRWIEKEKEPPSPTLIIFAWNFPYLVIVNSLVPALLGGNSVVIKPSPQTPLVADRLVEIFKQAGLPDDVLQAMHVGKPDAMRGIVRIPDIKFITFTGSTQGGQALCESTASRFLPVNLELGGNGSAYVRPDADLRYVAEELVDVAVFNAGQSCCAIERFYVHADISHSQLAEIQKELAKYKLGDPTQHSTNVGSVISRAAQTNVNAHIQDALSKGAVNETPTNPTFSSPPADGNYVVPTILTNVNHNMIVMQETFGPVIPIMKVSSDEEAVKLMNDSDYGLTTSVWTKDVDTGEKLFKVLEAGTVFINRCDYPNHDLAWTGWRNSDMGFTLGPRAFDPFIKLKSYHIREKQHD
ncbi:Aldehyde/histidinol dehydrogenase [Aspergillus filifer]